MIDPFEPYLREAFGDLSRPDSRTPVWREIKERGTARRLQRRARSRARSSPHPRRRIRSALLRRRPASRRRSTSPSSTSSSPTSQGLSASSGSSRWCSALPPADLGALRRPPRTCRASCAAISPPSRRSTAYPGEILYDRMKTAVIRRGRAMGSSSTSRACRSRPPLPFPAARLRRPYRAEDQGQGGAAVSLHPPGFFPRRDLP